MPCHGSNIVLGMGSRSMGERGWDMEVDQCIRGKSTEVHEECEGRGESACLNTGARGLMVGAQVIRVQWEGREKSVQGFVVRRL